MSLPAPAPPALNGLASSPTDSVINPVPPSLKRRMASWLYEGMLLFGVVFIAGYLFGTLSQTRNALDNRLALQLFLFVIFGIYFVWFWHKGQTLAMKTWHLRLLDTQGQPVSQLRALLRYALSWLWIAPPLAIAMAFGMATGGIVAVLLVWIALYAQLARFMPRQQFLHDAWAGTQLVNHAPMSK